MRKLLLLLLLPGFAAAREPENPEAGAPRAELAGTWEGTLACGDNRLRLVFRVAESDDGLAAVLDSPDQGARDLPVERVTFRPPEVLLDMPALQASYRGVLLPGGVLMGVFTQAGVDIALSLTHRKSAPPVRPQEPRPPFPYACCEVVFPSRNGAVELHGTLTLPASESPAPAVVLVTGSGLQNRDEEVFGHKPFAVVADFLTRAGIAVLRYDDRGYGLGEAERRASAPSTSDDFAQDALGAFDLLAARPEIDPRRIGILGHSEGGTVAFLAAAEEPCVAFVISLAGALVRGDRILLRQNRLAMERRGLPADLIEDCCDLLERIYALVRAHTPEELAADAAGFKSRLAAGSPLPEAVSGRLLEAVDAAAGSPWMYRFLTRDPAGAIACIGTRPVLAVNGSLDRQVDAAENLGALRRLLGARESLTVKCYEGLNHLFQPCTTGDVSEYERIETTVAPEVLADLSAWIGSRVGR